MDCCSPRVRNLQVEMDLLRTEIQRLKAIDINSLPNKNIKSHCLGRDSSRSSDRIEHKESDSFSKADAKMKLIQMGMASQAHLSDSDVSDDEGSGIADFDSFIQQLTSDKAQSIRPDSREHFLIEARGLASDPSVDSGKTIPSDLNQWEKGNAASHPDKILISKEAQTDAYVCLECTVLQQERSNLVNAIHEKEELLKWKQNCLKEIEEKANRSIAP